MGRDGRGTPGRTPKKDHTPRLRLADLLRRRRTTLTTFVGSLGVTTHAALAIWCDRMGVIPPTQEEFDVSFPLSSRVNSAKEGVIVLQAPPVIDEFTGNEIDPEAPVEPPGILVVIDSAPQVAVEKDTEASQKKPRKKKEGQ